MEKENNLMQAQGNAAVEDGTCASSLPGSTVWRTIGKTTYVASLHFLKSRDRPFHRNQL